MTTSVGPPAARATTRRMGRVGYGCSAARAGCAAATAQAIITPAAVDPSDCRNRGLFASTLVPRKWGQNHIFKNRLRPQLKVPALGQLNLLARRITQKAVLRKHIRVVTQRIARDGDHV